MAYIIVTPQPTLKRKLNRLDIDRILLAEIKRLIHLIYIDYRARWVTSVNAMCESIRLPLSSIKRHIIKKKLVELYNLSPCMGSAADLTAF